MKFPKIIDLAEFIPYFFIGAAVTFIDWFLFWILVTLFNVYSQIALVVAYGTAGLTHYFSNKHFSFKCNSKQYATQLSLYLTVTGIGLLFSLLIMQSIISFFHIHSIYARMITTGLMLIPNYLLHKNLSFSKKFFHSH